MEIFQKVADLKPTRIWEGVLARVVNGERLTIGFVDLDPNIQVPEHTHENEQVGFVQRGSITMVIAGESRELGVGGTYRIRSNVPHSARTGPAGASVVDVFAPLRADWAKLPQLAPSPGRWPETSR